MGEPGTTPITTYGEYLAIEQTSGRKHEWLDGQVYAMAGGTPTHSALSGRMIAALDALIGDRPCEKFRHYRSLASLRDYVLVSQHEPHVEVYSRDTAGRWVMSEADAGGSVAVASLGGVIDVDRVYRGIELEPTDASGRPGG
jgi:Uma2 family endonuclease